MVLEFYLSGSAWTSSAVHGHFVDLYSAFKQAICILPLSLSGYAKKSPSVYEKGNADIEGHLDDLSIASKFGSGKQSNSWLGEKSLEHKNKFETGQKNQLEDVLRNRKLRKKRNNLMHLKIGKQLHKLLHSLS